MIRAFTGAALASAAALAAPAAAAERPRQVQLPLPWVPLDAPPPLTSDAVQMAEVRVPRPLSSDERIRVGVDAAGAPMRIEVEQRLILQTAGDYTFIVPAPVNDVLPGPGTDSAPGFLRGAILWQGFSPGRRTLVAVAKLETRAAATHLPLRISLRAAVGGAPLRAGSRRSGPLDLTLVVENRTATTGIGYSGRAVPREIAAVLDQTWRALRRRKQLPLGFVTVHGSVENRRYMVDAGFRLDGELVFPAGRLTGARVSGADVTTAAGAVRLRLDGRVGAGAPARLVVRLRGQAANLAAPKLVLRATPVRDVPGLRPPRGGSWVRALRRRLVEPDGRRFLAVACQAFLRLARTTQYQTYLLNPDVANAPASSRAVYIYSTAVTPRVALPRGADSGLGALATAAVVIGSVLAAGALVVLWAHL